MIATPRAPSLAYFPKPLPFMPTTPQRCPARGQLVRSRTRHWLVDDVPVRAGQFLRIKVLDHVIFTPSRHSSLRELGWFHP